MGSLITDVHHSVRSLVKRPSFSLPVIATIALGIGATTTIFSVLDCVALRALPYPNSEELVFFENAAHSVPLYLDWRDHTSSYTTVAGAWEDEFDLTGEGRPVRVHGARVTPDFLEMLGTSSYRGRLFSGDDFDAPPQVAVVSHRLWLSRWGRDETLIGRTIIVDGHPLTVVGVLDHEVEFAQAGIGVEVDVLVPLFIANPVLRSRGMMVLSVIARLRPGVSLQAAQTELDALSTRLSAEHPDYYQRDDGSPRLQLITSLLDATVGDVRGALYLLLGAVTFLLLIACANVANLFLARGSDREHEMAVRSALGAGRRRVVAQLLTESVTISLIGGLAGVAFAVLGVEAVKLLDPGGIPRITSVTVDQRVLWFALSLSVLTGILFGLAPAAQASRLGVGDALKNAAQAVTANRRRFRLRDALVVSEITVAFILLVGAGLLFNSFVRLVNVDTKFDTENLITTQLSLDAGFSGPERAQFARDLEEQLDAIPGVEGIAMSTTLPFYSRTGRVCCWAGGFGSQPDPDAAGLWAVVHPVTPSYLDILDIRLVEGRNLTQSDDSASGSALVNAALARLEFGDVSAVGRSLYFHEQRFTIVGVVEDIRHWGLLPSHGEGDLVGYSVYVPHRVFASRFRQLAIGVKSPLDIGAIAPALREAIWALRPDLPVPDITTMQARISYSTADRRFFTATLLLFAVVASLLASLGIYGSMLYSVRQRRRELGIRLALGALQGGVIAMVVRRGMTLTAVGIGLGLVGGWGVSRTLESFLFGITTHDASTYLGVVVLLATVAFAACYLPARRAASVDPTETLKAE